MCLIVFRFEYVPHKLELTTMSYTECHHRVVALVKDVQIQMWSRFSAQCGMPKWFHDIRFMIAASGPKYTTLWSVPADKKIPVDNLNRFIISGRTVQSYMTSIFEVVKSQGLYTPNAKTTKTLNKDGALNKVSLGRAHLSPQSQLSGYLSAWMCYWMALTVI